MARVRENERSLTAAGILAAPEDFSLVLGGPLYQLWRRLHISGAGLELLVRRMLVIPLVAWLPLLILTAWQGLAIGNAVAVPFLYDLDAHARFLVAVPLFLLAEILVHQRLRLVVGQFVNAGIVPPQTLPKFQAEIARALRLRNSLAVELVAVIFLFGFGWMYWEARSALSAASTWYAFSDSTGRHLTAAGQWYSHISVPIFQFLWFRWYYRLFVWSLFLLRVSRLNLQLTPTHPDRAGGLGFLALGPTAFAPVILAQSILLSALIAARILFEGAKLDSFKYEIVAFVIIQLILILGPLCVYAPKLLALKRQGIREYGALAGRYTRAFQEKWIGRTTPPDDALVGTGDIQSLADLANSYEVVRTMQAVPFGRDTILQVAVPALIPFLPLVLTVIPAEEIVKRLMGMLL